MSFLNQNALSFSNASLNRGAGVNTYSVTFDGDIGEQYASGTNTQSITSTAFTVEFWVRPFSFSANTANPRFIDISDATNSFQITRSTGSARIHTKHTQTDSGTNSKKWGSADLTLDTWYHIAAVVNSSGAVDNVYLAASGDSSHTDLSSAAGDAVGAGTAASDTFIGVRRDLVARSGILQDEVRVWNGSRSLVQIDANWKTQLFGNESGLVAYYRLNNDYTDSQTNASANNLTASGSSPVFTTVIPF